MKNIVAEIDHAINDLLPDAQQQVLSFIYFLKNKHATSVGHHSAGSATEPVDFTHGDYVKFLLKSMPDVGEDEDFYRAGEIERERLEWDF